MIKSDEAKGIVYVALAAAAIIGVFVLGGKLLKAFGLAKDESDKKAAATTGTAERLGYFLPEFIRNTPKGTALITRQAANVKASNIYHAIGVIYDEPEKIAAAFSNIATKSQVSFLAFVFKTNYGIDLLTFLKNKLDTDEQQTVLATILDRLNNLPNFYINNKPPLIK